MKPSIALLFFISILTVSGMQAQTPLRYLALGDSYTIGEAVAEVERWPVQLVKRWRDAGRAVADPRIIATTGWRTDNLKAAMTAANLTNDWDIVSLLIGVNNQYQGKPADQYAIEFEGLLNDAIRLAGGRKDRVFVVSIPDYGYTPFGQPKQEAITRALNEFNSINERITRAHGVTYVPITDISREGLDKPELVATDKLHPSGAMYTRWTDRIFAQFVLPRP
ncbi:MAG: SGNH/GDSL hydrolase family protein [Cyclobacteriaceae bacterium]|jgi:lysophospholipase L1-like esterase